MGADPVSRTALFGGSFNPVHWGHIRPVAAARRRFRRDRVVYLPAPRPPHKPGRRFEDPFHRFACLARCLAPHPGLVLSPYELHRPGTATVETLAHFRSILEGELYLILGSDSLLQFHTWREPERILDLARLIVLARPGAEAHREALPPFLAREWGRRVLPFVHPRVGTSSTLLREALAAGRIPRGWMPAAAVQYIRIHQLYREV
jgi:nicotinate-nucleotide adenylyltransferase